MNGSPLIIVGGVSVLSIAFACAVGALVRREERRGRSVAARDEPRAAARPARAESARREPDPKQPRPAEDPLLTLYLRDYSGPR